MQEKLSEVILILIGSALITIILSGLIVFALFIGQRRKFRHRKELIELKHNYDQEVLKTQLETQLQTFETISRELHDNVGTLLSIAIVHQKSLGGETEKRTHETLQLLEEAHDLLRDISRSINPENIHRKGLEQSIRDELNRIKRLKLFKTEYMSEGIEFPIDPQKHVILFRIIQEGLNNIVKHSGAEKIAVSVTFNEPSLVVSISDNGKGFVFQPEHGDFMNHSGIQNMVKRGRLINGKVTINSEPGKGTLIRIDYPVT